MRKSFKLMSTNYIVRADSIGQKDLKPGLCAELGKYVFQGDACPEFETWGSSRFEPYKTLEEAYDALDKERYFEVLKTKDQLGERYEVSEIIIVEDIFDGDGDLTESVEHYHEAEKPELITLEMITEIRRGEDERLTFLIENSDEYGIKDTFDVLIGEPFYGYESLEADMLEIVKNGYYDGDADEYFFRFDWETIVNYMDDELREELHSSKKWDSNKAFYDAYCEAHEERFGEEFEIN